jgi:hypothetical protein
MAARLRSHKSITKLKLKKPKKQDIFFGREIEAESSRMLNQRQIEKMK